MPSKGADFIHLHQLRRQLKEVQDQLARGPRQIKLRQAKVTEAEASAAAKEQELKESKIALDRKNLELKSKETHWLDLQAKLNTASSNREYDIISGQIAADKAAKSVLEDEILEYLDRVDALQKELVLCRQAVKNAEQETRSFAAEFEQKAVGLHEQEKLLNSQVSRAEEVIPADKLALYRRLVEAHGADALAAVENGVCSYCFVGLTPQAQVIIRNGTLLICGSCGRLLYNPEDGSGN